MVIALTQKDFEDAQITNSMISEKSKYESRTDATLLEDRRHTARARIEQAHYELRLDELSAQIRIAAMLSEALDRFKSWRL